MRDNSFKDLKSHSGVVKHYNLGFFSLALQESPCNARKEHSFKSVLFHYLLNWKGYLSFFD